MSVSKDARWENLALGLNLMCEALGPQSVRMFLVNSEDDRYKDILPTTWLELVNQAFIERSHMRPFYVLTGHGWLTYVERKGMLDDPTFKDILGVLCSNLKNAIKGRQDIALLNISDVARDTQIPEGIISNIIDAHIIDYILKRYGAEWVTGFAGRMIKVPANFGLERL